MKNTYTVKCPKCGKLFDIQCTENDFRKGKYRKFCSASCANSRVHSNETKDKIRKALTKKSYIRKKDETIYLYKCKFCGKEYSTNTRTKFCSDKCRHMNNLIPTFTKYFSFDNEYLGTENAYNEVNRIKNELIELYWNKNLNGHDIAKLYNYPSYCNITGKIFKYLDIPVRNLSETETLNYLNGKIKTNINPKYKQGWHKTWNNKEVYLHSSYEFEYAKELDELKIDYDVECFRIKYFDTQKNTYRCAIPDFYLPETNTIVEIKSSYTLDKQEMKDKFLEYKNLGYTCKLIVNFEEVNINTL